MIVGLRRLRARIKTFRTEPERKESKMSLREIMDSSSSSGSEANNRQSNLCLLELPDIVQRRIFSFLSYDEIARLRIVCKDFDIMGKTVLNKGLVAVEKFRNMCLKEVKIQLPRRESERRVHPLARHVDVLMAIETRISMLSMTYGKYIDSGLCCFIPGKVLDEMFRVLRIVRESKTPPRPHEILQELRDISSMAMEHFDEKVCSSLKPKFTIILFPGTPKAKSLLTLKMSNDEVDAVQAVQTNLQKVKGNCTELRKQVKSLRSKVLKLGGKIDDNKSKLQDQSAKISEQGAQIQDLRRVVDELSQKVLDISRSHDTSMNKSSSKGGSSNKISSVKAFFSGSHTSQSGVVTRSKRARAQDTESDPVPPKKMC
ncbi:F-box only protein 28 isoform X1 [Cloeon dipterum]|uniref:F-box only protein 28 isoform X1 n=2 Tax=Cloeon dipterum TaxID=197152 RepID=UPI00322018C3